MGTLLFLSNQKQVTDAPVSCIAFDLLEYENYAIRSIALRNKRKLIQVLLQESPIR